MKPGCAAADERLDVSVALITYNHERFVAQAIDSVLEQRGVRLELLIAEDRSTDATRRIVEDYARRHPGLIRLFLSPRNLNTNEVLSRPIEAARGRYVALLDGDDYWTSPHKLRTQVEALDAHPGWAICFHNATVVHDDGTPPHPFHLSRPVHRVSRPLPAPLTTLADIAPGNYMQTCTVMFRRGLFGAFPPWYAGFVVGDWPLHVLNAQHGSIGYLDETLAAYRVHAGGLWSNGMSRYERRQWVDALADAYRVLDEHLDGRFHAEFRRRVTNLYLDAATAAHAAGRTGDAVHHARRYLALLPLGARLLPGPLFRTIVRSWRGRPSRRGASSLPARDPA
ncbi:MAG TPA: glycosyltransferase [Gemmatimonadales bacterium]